LQKREVILFSLTKQIFLLGVFILFFIILSCKNINNPDQTLYENLLKNLKYISYKTLSENTIPPLVLLFNTTNHVDEPMVSEGVLRLLLGYSWVVSGKADYAIAENNIIQDMSTDDKDIKILGHSLAAIAMFEKGWKTLAADESEKANKLLNKEPKPMDAQLKIMTFHLIMGSLCIYEENYQTARFHFAWFNIISKIEWPYLIVDAMTDLKENNNKQGMKKIKTLLDQKHLPDSIIKSISDNYTKAENAKGTIDEKLFWTNTNSVALYNEIKDADIPNVDKIMELLGKIREKLKID
jgi:hypothetical protein